MTKEAKLVKPQNKLKEKVGDGGFNVEDIKKAQMAIDNNEVDFAPVALDLIQDLEKALKADPQQKDFEQIVMLPILQLKSQGAFFKYPSVTDLSKIIINFSERVERLDNDALKIIASYLQSIKVFIASEIKESKNPVYVSLETELKAVCARYIKKHQVKA